jgi:hypothetical protein
VLYQSVTLKITWYNDEDEERFKAEAGNGKEVVAFQRTKAQNKYGCSSNYPKEPHNLSIVGLDLEQPCLI